METQACKRKHIVTNLSILHIFFSYCDSLSFCEKVFFPLKPKHFNNQSLLHGYSPAISSVFCTSVCRGNKYIVAMLGDLPFVWQTFVHSKALSANVILLVQNKADKSKPSCKLLMQFWNLELSANCQVGLFHLPAWSSVVCQQ